MAYQGNRAFHMNDKAREAFIQKLYGTSSESNTCHNVGCNVMETAETPLHQCNGCGFALYCSTKCQRAHWPIHKRECKSCNRSAVKMSANDQITAFDDRFYPVVTALATAIILGFGSPDLIRSHFVVFVLGKAPGQSNELEIHHFALKPITILTEMTSENIDACMHTENAKMVRIFYELPTGNGFSLHKVYFRPGLNLTYTVAGMEKWTAQERGAYYRNEALLWLQWISDVAQGKKKLPNDK